MTPADGYLVSEKVKKRDLTNNGLLQKPDFTIAKSAEHRCPSCRSKTGLQIASLSAKLPEVLVRTLVIVTGDVGRAFQAFGVALPPNIREANAVAAPCRPGDVHPPAAACGANNPDCDATR
jgi:hypothetical protein